MILPQILGTTASERSVTLALAVPPEVCIGHFPGHPVVAGVIQLDWALRLSGQHFPEVPPTAQDFQIKFRRIIQPQDPLALQLDWDPEKHALTFTYRVGDAIASSGRVKLP